jgi:outer membrane lipoprotein SlyB
MRFGAIAAGDSALNVGSKSLQFLEENIMSNPTHTHATATSGFGEKPHAGSSSFSKPAALIGGAVALVALTAIATTIAIRPDSPAGDAGAAAVATSALLASSKADEKVPAKADDKAAADDGAEKAEAPKPRAAAAKPALRPAAKPAAHAVEQQQEQHAAAPVCHSCGVVESVTPFQQKGEASGVGAVAGGVIGGVLGHQMGGGRGKDAMTAIGVVGGGIAGHEIEKRQRSTTMYSVKVRMEDGSLRTVTQASPASVGQKVTVEGSQVKARA